jgi:glycoside/pentoside/hexuronide:cation symporter, GPH family
VTATPLGRKLGWAVGDFGFNIYWQALNLLMMPFYTDVLGLDPVLAGTVFLIASLWDGFADSVIGAIADRTRTRHGSYRPYLLWGPPLIALAFMITFFTPDLSMGGLFAYALGGQILVRTAYSLVQIPYSSLSSRITGDADERASMAGYRVSFAMLGGIAVTFLMPSIVDALDGALGPTNWTYVAAAGVAGLVSLPAFWLCFAATHEPAALRDRNPQGFHWGAVGEDFRTVMQIARVNGPLMRVFACMIVSSLAFTMTNKCVTYYVNGWLERPDLRQYILPFTLFVNLLFCPFWAWIAQRTSKREAWLWASAVSAIAYLVFYLLPTRDPLVATALLGLIAVGNAAYITLVWAMLPDTVEYTEWKTGQRHDAKVFGVASFAKQFALGLNGFVLGALLGAVGYVEKATVQSIAAIEGVRAIMSLVPLAGIAIAAAIVWGYRLDQATHRRISEEVQRRTRVAMGET